MVVPYCMIHFGKPFLETMAAIVAVVVLGTLSMKTRSIWSGFLIHVSVAVSMDIFSTCCAAAGVSAGSDVDGVSFLPTLTGEPQPTPARNLYFTRREGGPYLGKTIEALIAGEWKLVADTPTSPVELFDLAKDPQEKQNLAAQEKLKLQELSKSLREHIQRGGSTPWQRK
jgi:arylsulfatase A-like enzyme